MKQHYDIIIVELEFLGCPAPISANKTIETLYYLKNPIGLAEGWGL